MRSVNDRLISYCFAMLVVLAASFVRFRLDPLFGPEAPFVLFVPAVALATVIGGGGPGIAATVLGLAEGSYYFVEPRFRFLTPDAGLGLEAFGYVISSLLVVGAISILRRSG